MTIEEAEALAQGRSFELIDGRIIFKKADTIHSNSQGILHGELYLYFKQNPIGKVLPELNLRLWPESHQNLRMPDIAVFLNENIHEEEKYETRAPVEIVSDDDRATAVFEKARMYLEKGGRMVWIIFPTEQSVVVITPKERRWESETLACPEILPGFRVEVAALFAWQPSAQGESSVAG